MEGLEESVKFSRGGQWGRNRIQGMQEIKHGLCSLQATVHEG